MMYTILIKHENDDTHIIENISYEDVEKIKNILFEEGKYKEKYNISAGDICHYKEKSSNNIFVVTKVIYEDHNGIIVGFFNAINADGDVIALGSLDLIEKIPNEDNHMILDLESFLYKIKKRGDK